VLRSSRAHQITGLLQQRHELKAPPMAVAGVLRETIVARRAAGDVQVLHGTPRQIRMTTRRVVHPVQRQVEPAEVVDRCRLQRGAYTRCRRHPVRHDHQHGIRAQQLTWS